MIRSGTSELMGYVRMQDDFFCHSHNRDGLVGVVFVDKEYPVRSAFCVVNKVQRPSKMPTMPYQRPIVDSSAYATFKETHAATATIFGPLCGV